MQVDVEAIILFSTCPLHLERSEAQVGNGKDRGSLEGPQEWRRLLLLRVLLCGSLEPCTKSSVQCFDRSKSGVEPEALLPSVLHLNTQHLQTQGYDNDLDGLSA